MELRLQTLSGTHHEIGVQQGLAARESLLSVLEVMPGSNAMKRIKPSWLPTYIYLYLARRRASNLLKKDIFEYYPKQAERLRGIAEGAGIGLSTALLLQSFELFLGSPRFRVDACTALGFPARRTKESEAILVKNFDYINDLEPYQSKIEAEPTGGYKTLGCSMSFLPGMLDGMNEHGLSVTYNLAYTTDKLSCFVPISIVLQEMLETCRSTDEAVKFITGAKRGGHDAILTIVDAEGDFKSVEITSNHVATREATDDVIINTNHFHTSEMQQYEIPHDAVSLDTGVRVHESSERRLMRAQELLGGRSKVGEGDILSILRDHGEEGEPSVNTICRHGEFASTLRSVIFHPERKTINVLFGRPCENEYQEIGFS